MKYRKSQIIDAVQVTDSWFTGVGSAENAEITVPHPDIPVGVTVDPVAKVVVMGDIALVKHLTAKVGDFIIVGPKTYPMHEEEFKKLYEEVK